MSGWYWVTNGSMAVDVNELVVASSHVDGGAKSAQTALSQMVNTRVSRGTPASFFGDWLAMMETPLGPVIADLSWQVQMLNAEISEALVDLRQSLREYSEWLAQAALIYSTAEQGSVGFANTCQMLDALGCSLPDPGSASGFTSWSSLLMVLPGHIQEFSGGANRIPTANLSTQNHILLAAGGEGGFAQSVVTVARWWRDIGSLVGGKSSGVVVMDENGAASWGSQAVLAMGLPILGRSQIESAGNARVDRALQRLGETAIQRGSATEVLANAGGKTVAEDGAWSPNRPTSVATPMTSAALLSRITTSGGTNEVGEVQIIKHSGVAGSAASSAWTVVVRGTRAWVPGSKNPQDMQSNLETVGRAPSDQKTSVEIAMKMAQIQPGEPVEFVGHSQGGAIALDLATDPWVNGHYNVVSVLTAGSPTGGFTPPDTVSVLHYENLSDIVPGLDGGAPKGGANVSTAYFDARSLKVPETADAHSLGTYVSAAVGMEAEGATNPMAAQIDNWNQNRVQAMGLQGPVSSEVQYYRSTRVR